MRKIILFIILVGAVPSFALNIDTEELNKARKVTFINYTGPSSRGTSERDMERIGESLARNSAVSGTARFYLKYSILHADDKAQSDKLAADILSIDRDARVNHINMIRKVISGYVRTKYGYARAESDAVAVVTTFYNAVYRGNVEYLGSRYKDVVMKKINAKNAGISLRYSDWPGRTKLILPLSENEKGTLDLFTLADEKTRDEIRKTPDRGVAERKEIIRMKDESLAAEKKDAERKDKEIAAKKEEIAKKEAEVAKEKKAAEEQKKAIAEEKKKAATITKPEEKKKALDTVAKKEEAVAKKESETAKKEEAVASDKTKTAEEQKSADQKKEETAKKEEDVKKEKESIAADEKAVADKMEAEKKIADKPADKKSVVEERKQLAAEKADVAKKKEELAKKEEALAAKLDKVIKDKFYYLKVNNWYNDGIYNNEMYIINPITRKVVLKSPYKTIAGRKYDIFPKGVVVIGYLGSGLKNFEHRLVLLDPDKLTPIASSKDVTFWRSFVEIRDGFIYCIYSDKDAKFFLARYNDNLERVALSSVEVDKDSVISFYQDFIYINSPDRKINVLKKDDLSFVQIIDPVKDQEK